MAWTEERVALLTKFWSEGHTASQIAELLGEGLTRNAVIGKAHRLGLPARPSPLKEKKDAKGSAKTGAAASAKPGATASAKKAGKPVRESGGAPESSTKTAAPKNGSEEAAATAPSGDAPAAPATGDAKKNVKKDIPAAPEKAATPEAKPSPVAAAQAASPAPAPSAARPDPRRKRAKARGKVTLLDLNDRVCRWPIGHPDEPDFHFCGQPVNPGFPYCAEHCLEAYQSQMPHRDRDDAGKGGGHDDAKKEARAPAH